MTEGQGGDRQRVHYNRILDEYDAHYGDAASLEYRRRFFLAPLLAGLDLNGLTVADVAAGSGHTTRELRAQFPHARLVGFDVSDEAVERYRRATGCEGHRLDLTQPGPVGRQFDVVVVIGGLHHCVRQLDTALQHIGSMLRPGGLFLMVEPSRDTLWEPLRRGWYSRDRYFDAATEGALSHGELLERGRQWFELESVRYLGGVAYFLVYNSLVFRIPLRLKAMIAPVLMALERPWNAIAPRSILPYFVARWRRTAAPGGASRARCG